MKRIIAILLLVSVASSFATGESADDIAKRVIVDKSSAHTPGPLISYVPPRPPEDDQMAYTAKEAHEAIVTYMLGDSTPEKVRIAYAIRVLEGKWIPASRTRQPGFIFFDKRKNAQFLKDAFILGARLAEIKKSEQGGADQPATAADSKYEGSEKPKPSLFFPTGSDWVHYDGVCPKTHYPIIIQGGAIPGDGVTYRAIFAEIPSKDFQHVALHGLQTAQYEKKMKELSAPGYVLIYHQQFMAKGGLTHQAVWVKGTSAAKEGEPDVAPNP
jgi:hypothetical protein